MINTFDELNKEFKGGFKRYKKYNNKRHEELEEEKKKLNDVIDNLIEACKSYEDIIEYYEELLIEKDKIIYKLRNIV